jgi:hypothetical protein
VVCCGDNGGRCCKGTGVIPCQWDQAGEEEGDCSESELGDGSGAGKVDLEICWTLIVRLLAWIEMYEPSGLLSSVIRSWRMIEGVKSCGRACKASHPLVVTVYVANA